MAKTLKLIKGRKRNYKYKYKSRKNYMKKGKFMIDTSKVHPASIVLNK